MATTVKIISESTCDLSKELGEKDDITILPLHILLGEDEYRDGVDITPEEIFRWSDENKTTPKTSAPSLTEAMEVMQPFVEEGREIICFSISDSMSTSGNVMRLAAEELEASDKVTVINSANLSTGIGLQMCIRDRTNAVVRKTGIFLYENGNVGTVQHGDMAAYAAQA